MKKLTARRLALIGFAIMMAIAALTYGRSSGDEVAEWPGAAAETADEIPISQAWRLLTTESMARQASVVGHFVFIETLPGTPETVDGDIVKARLPFPAATMVSRMAEEAVIDFRIHSNQGFGPSWSDRALQILPALIIIGLLAFFLLRGATRSLGLNKSFDIIEGDKLRETFSDVAGIDAARAEIQEIVDFLKDPEEASRLGGRMPKGALFDGPPGSGKTLLARAMAREAGVPFMSIDAAGMNQIFVGAGAMKVKKVFKEARKRAPCIVFIDEIDSMGRARGGMRGGSGDEKETTLNALLVELDGFGPREGIVVIAATNRPEILDPALTRRGRIDRRISIGLPDIEGRKEILRVHCRKIKAEADLDLSMIAGTTFGFSGADLAALVNEAALHATRKGQDTVTLADFAAARDRMIVGLSGTDRKLSEEDRRLTAVHEAGHAMIAALEPHADPIEKVTILPQGRAAGYVMQSPNQDRIFETRARLNARIRVAVAGRVAEEVVFGRDAITSGAMSDIEQATRIAREMVMTLGMSDLGFIRFDPNDFALQDMENPPVREVRRMINDAMAQVMQIMTQKKDLLIGLSDTLVQQEVMTGADVSRLLAETEPAAA